MEDETNMYGIGDISGSLSDLMTKKQVDLNPKTPKYGTQESQGLALSQQSLSQQPSDYMRTDKMVPPPEPVFVEGIGMLGADLGGYGKGLQLNQELALKNNEDVRAGETLGISKEKLANEQDYVKIAQAELGIKLDDQAMKREEFGWKKQDRAKQEALFSGMQQAASQGGYGGVVDFLKTADPMMAVDFHSKKLSLDASIMKNDVMKTLGPLEKNKAMVESYGLLGKMGKAVLDAKPEERQNMLEAMQPMLKTVLGENAPKTLEEAIPQFALGIAQATPEAILYQDQKSSQITATEIGKTNVALSNMAAKGITPANNQTARDLNEHLKALQAEDQVKQNKLTESMANIDAINTSKAKSEGELRSQQMVADKNLASRYKEETSKTGEFVESYNTFNSAYDIWKSGKGGAAAETAMTRSLAMIFAGGKMSDNDAVAFAGSDSGAMQLLRRVRSSYNESGMIVANPSEIGRLKDLIGEMYKGRLPKLQETNERYQKLQKQFNISEDAIPYYKTPPKEEPKPPMSAIQITDMYKKALANPKAKDPNIKKMIDQRYQEQMQQFQPQQQQGAPMEGN